ncbi:uncharacterized protein LOC113342013 [Papaver somniferum]|uniref:uncharacterized protein LOC113342013 n=1 Tax=Papaver somniferum TaxID=3469 RepID=UPI000E6F8476|nr:uncharacterized protein LOC113342013 [Papaver somniferum]
MKIRQTQNAIVELENNEGNIISSQQDISEVLLKHFEDKFKFQHTHTVDGVFDAIPILVHAEDNQMLAAIPSFDEIHKAVLDMDPDSAPGPYGFSGWFYKATWHIIGEDFLNLYNTAGPKVSFQLQGAFIKRRNIQDQIVLASELVNELETKRRGGNMALKIDIAQAYDSISWQFLFQAMKSFGFSEKHIEWIHILLKSRKISVLINGGPVGYFSVWRGLRQGDPLSPLLFVITEVVLSRTISSMVDKNLLIPMVNINGIQPTHIFFVDDIFMFCNGDKKNLRRLMKTLKDYQQASGQIVSASKSKCFVGGDPGQAGFGFMGRDWNGEVLVDASGGMGIATNFLAEVMTVLCADSKATVAAFISRNLPWIAITRWNNICAKLQ